MKKQYIVCKYVNADSVTEAIQKSKRFPVHEVYVHNAWWEKAHGFSFFEESRDLPGFQQPK